MALKKTSSRNQIIVKGARVNNLKNIDVEIPRDQLVVVTGLSGSGKSSLAFDTIYAEGNRRYMEGFSSYIRNFLDPASKPDVDRIENLSPPISIDQKSVSRSPRSTVGTLTETYDYLRIMFSKVGTVYCPNCDSLMQRRTNREILEEIMALPHHTQLAILARPKVNGENYTENLKSAQQLGYARVRVGSKVLTISEAANLEEQPEIVELVIDRIVLDQKKPDQERILDSIETAMKVGAGSMLLMIDGKEDRFFNNDFYCAHCDYKLRDITPRHFSFNSPEGACATCAGLGHVFKINQELVLPNWKLSLAEGAILPWSKSGGKINGGGTNFLALKTLAKAHNFSLETPLKKLSKAQVELILQGDKTGKTNFEGVIPQLEKKFQETKSEYMRTEIERCMTAHVCPVCAGKRLRQEYLAIKAGDKNIDQLVKMGVSELKNYLAAYEKWAPSEDVKKLLRPLVREINTRLEALENVGLEYLNLGRSAQTISGGEAQRIRLAAQLNSLLMGIVYVLDEPSIGLHNRDTEKLIETLKRLQELGNSLVVVEHDDSIIKAADWVIDMGPGAGEEGGTVIFTGPYAKLAKSKSLTGQYITGKKKVFEKKKYRKGSGKLIEIIGAKENNLQNVDAKIPLGKFVAVCGVSGSGKSTLINDILSKALSRHFFGSKELPGEHKKIKGLEHVSKVISIDQAPIGRTPRSNAATYTGVFTHIRDLFAETEEAKNRGYSASRFSFNMKGGRCEVCQGEGSRKIEMHLLPDMYVKCEACDGTRYNKKTLEIEYKGFNIAQVLDMDVHLAYRFFARHPLIAEKLKTMEDVGLGYLKLGQSATNLSGGEAQRIKLATELARKSTGNTLYVLDEPTVGLHFEDIRRLLFVLDALVEKGNSVLVVEHNTEVVKAADWVIELGPEGGSGGGKLVFEGTPQDLKKKGKTWTARYL